MVGTHWQSETERGRQMPGLDVSELLVEEKQIWIWRTLSSLAGGSERVSGCCVALGCGKLYGWVYRCVKGTVSAGYMGMYWRFQNVPEDWWNP